MKTRKGTMEAKEGRKTKLDIPVEQRNVCCFGYRERGLKFHFLHSYLQPDKTSACEKLAVRSETHFNILIHILLCADLSSHHVFVGHEELIKPLSHRGVYKV